MFWKDIEVNKNYEVSSTGLVKNKKTGRVLKPWKTMGYPTIRFTLGGKSYRVHRLVAIAFIPKVKGKHFVNHKDSDRCNNNVDNLEWCTKSENTKHGFDFGNVTQGFQKNHKNSVGSKNTLAKLKESDVIKIKQLRNEGLTLQAIGDIFNVSLATIGYIIQGKTWSHVKV